MQASPLTPQPIVRKHLCHHNDLQKCVSRLPPPRSLLQSPRTACPLQPQVQSLASPPGPPVVRKTCRPSLTAAAQQAPPLHKVQHHAHRCPRRRPVRESAAAKHSDTFTPVTIHESPANISLHDEHSGSRAHPGGSPGKARLPDAVKKEMERPKAGLARRGKIKLGRDPPAISPTSHPPVFSKSPLTERLGSPAFLS